MALLLAWVSLGTCAFLAALLFVLWIDTRGDRRALGAAQDTIATLQRRVADQEAAIGRLTGALVGMAPLALVEGDRAPAPEREPTPASRRRRVEIDETPTLRTGTRPASARLVALRRTAEAQGLPAEHCGGRACKRPEGCACACDACERLHIIELLVEATPEAAASLVAEGEAVLTPGELARVDALAAERGVTRREAILLCLLAARSAND